MSIPYFLLATRDKHRQPHETRLSKQPTLKYPSRNCPEVDGEMSKLCHSLNFEINIIFTVSKLRVSRMTFPLVGHVVFERVQMMSSTPVH